MAGTTLTDRSVVRLSGENVRQFLQGLVTSDVNGTGPIWAGLLSPQGKCLFDFMIFSDGNDLLIDCEAGACEDLIRRLAFYRLRRAITIARDPELAVHWSTHRGDKPDPRLEELGFRWLGPVDEPASGWLEHRLRLGVCEGRSELGDTLWLECNAAELNGVSFAKGCFIGQENTARMNWRQKVNRRLVVVETNECGPRTKILYPDLGLAVEHRRADELEGAIVPDWLQRSIEKHGVA
jgi:folate-binding protein YgfZ